jgi:poly(hydroxyalkanoate) depolymerase family esterase
MLRRSNHCPVGRLSSARPYQGAAVSLADNIEFLRRLPKIPKIKGLGESGEGQAATAGVLTETAGFGENPGALKMLSFAPQHGEGAMPLVVVLHGCTQTAAAYDAGSGWSALAERYGFALLFPEQASANNGNRCFNWFEPDDIRRDMGEVASIRQMVARMAQDHGIDERRVYVTGLSAGGAMTSALLATYPDVFAAGAIIAGLPYGTVTNVQEALTAMYRPATRAPHALGDLVRNASPHRGPWPKVSVWHGSADRTVAPANAMNVIRQWLDVHGLPMRPMSEGLVNGHPHQVWWNAAGETIVESYSITDMAHGTPLGIGDNDERYGTAGAHMLEAGISSSYRIASFFDLTDAIRRPRFAAQFEPAPESLEIRPEAHPDVLPGTAVARGPAAQAHRVRPKLHIKPGVDINSVITRALTAAGLMK